MNRSQPGDDDGKPGDANAERPSPAARIAFHDMLARLDQQLDQGLAGLPPTPGSGTRTAGPASRDKVPAGAPDEVQGGVPAQPTGGSRGGPATERVRTTATSAAARPTATKPPRGPATSAPPTIGGAAAVDRLLHGLGQRPVAAALLAAAAVAVPVAAQFLSGKPSRPLAAAAPALIEADTPPAPRPRAAEPAAAASVPTPTPPTVTPEPAVAAAQDPAPPATTTAASAPVAAAASAPSPPPARAPGCAAAADALGLCSALSP
ncbi:hypothetical protein [Caldimonas brevitalea]|uniref:Uncharacterized protein n=1 Tax=Caldimonas brevitalea TaxID=413882 RepID=A0A0G3BIL5_9BURK|nr:hypothetical protein [Caldimonas brevitalea]AKJ27803.1 hypothetical protein AAW51_1112 [Caldimonas brevitalea]